MKRQCSYKRFTWNYGWWDNAFKLYNEEWIKEAFLVSRDTFNSVDYRDTFNSVDYRDTFNSGDYRDTFNIILNKIRFKIMKQSTGYIQLHHQ